jgi:hypothetical protein
MLSGSVVVTPTDPDLPRVDNPLGVASVASPEFDLKPGSFWLDDTSDVAFTVTAPAVEAGKEPPEVSRLTF